MSSNLEFNFRIFSGTKPIVTVFENDEASPKTWEGRVIFSNGRGLTETYNSYETAERVCQALAERSQFVFLPPLLPRVVNLCTTVGCYQSESGERKFGVVILQPNKEKALGLDEIRVIGDYDTFDQAKTGAEDIASKTDIACEPFFYLQRSENEISIMCAICPDRDHRRRSIIPLLSQEQPRFMPR